MVTGDVSSQDYFLAQERWVDFWGGKGEPIPNFGRYLGFSRGFTSLSSPYNASRSIVFTVRSEAARKIRMLAGPHYHAVLTAYKIRKNK